MGTIKIRSFEDMDRWQALLRVICNECGHEAHFHPQTMINYFREKRWSTSLDSAGQRFKCQGKVGDKVCCSRRVTLKAITPKLELPEPRPQPVATDPCPLGVDGQAWAAADSYERKRLIRRARG